MKGIVLFPTLIYKKGFYRLDRKDVKATRRSEKKFARYQEGAEKYSLGLKKF